jgi:hypothetical protein
MRFLPPRWELLFRRGDLVRILIRCSREVKKKFRSSVNRVADFSVCTGLLGEPDGRPRFA